MGTYLEPDSESGDSDVAHLGSATATRELVPVTPAQQQIAAPAMLMPLTDAAGAKAAIAAYEHLKSAIVRDTDIQHIQGRDFLKKPFWRRVARCFGLSVELVREERLELDGKLAYRVIYRAIAPNGQSMDGDGMMVYGEKGQIIEHNIRAIAHTRAKNRAISDLVGGGEVSAEEMPDEDERQEARAAKAQADAWEHVKSLATALRLSGPEKTALTNEHHRDPQAIYAALVKRVAVLMGRPAAPAAVTVTEADPGVPESEPTAYLVLGDAAWMARAGELGYPTMGEVEELLAAHGETLQTITRETAAAILRAEEQRQAERSLRLENGTGKARAKGGAK